MNGFTSVKWLMVCLSLTVGILASSCGMPGVKSLEPGERVEFPGISVSVPEESNWVYTHDVRGNDHYLSFFRQGGSSTYTFVTNVQVSQLPPEALIDGLPDPNEFLSGIAEYCWTDSPRFQVVDDSHELEPRFADQCVRSEATAKDTQAANKGDADHLVLKEKEYNFVIEPDNQSAPLFVHIGYTERGKEQEIGSDFDLRAAQFFAAVEVTR